MEHTSEKDVLDFLSQDILLNPAEQEDPIKIDLPVSLGSGIFTDHDVHPMVYEFVLINKYKTKWIHWDPDELWDRIKNDFRQDINDIAKNKIQSLRTLQIIDRYWREPEVFENVSSSFNDMVPYFNITEFLTPSQMSFSIDISSLIDDHKFEEDIGCYIVAMCSESGLIFLCDNLSQFQEYSQSLPHYKEFKNIIDESIDMWKNVQGKDPDTIDLEDDNPVHVQISKSLAIKRYLENKEIQFQEQVKRFRS